MPLGITNPDPHMSEDNLKQGTHHTPLLLSNKVALDPTSASVTSRCSHIVCGLGLLDERVNSLACRCFHNL